MKKRLMSAFVAVTMFVSVATSNMVQVQAGTLEIVVLHVPSLH